MKMFNKLLNLFKKTPEQIELKAKNKLIRAKEKECTDMGFTTSFLYQDIYGSRCELCGHEIGTWQWDNIGRCNAGYIVGPKCKEMMDRPEVGDLYVDRDDSSKTLTISEAKFDSTKGCFRVGFYLPEYGYEIYQIQRLDEKDLYRWYKKL